MSFQISALEADRFEALFALSDERLAEHLAVRVTATSKPGFPCRVSLADAEVGEELLLVNHQHLTEATPFRATYAIYVRKGAARARPAVGEVPEQLRTRTLALRAFDAAGMLVAADLAEGTALEPTLERLLAEPEAAYVHIHYAKPGCYAARADRA
jgi:hypothetical protein